MLMAYEKGADLIVTVGAHFNLIEFLDRKRGGMSSTFLTRLRIGEKLVDAKGVSRLYNPPSTVAPAALFLVAFVILLVVLVITSPALNDLFELLWLKVKIWLGAIAPATTPLSLIAVFLALAIGILIGAEFGGDTLSNTRKDLEHSLTGNLQDARQRADQLNGELGRANEFSGRVYPVLVRDRLRGRRIGLIAFGDLPGDVYGAIEGALAPAGGHLVGVGVVREPIDTRGLAGDLAKTRFAKLAREPELQTALGAGLGRQIVRGGTLLEPVRGHLFSRASGNFGALDAVIVVRDEPQNMGPQQRAVAGRIESGMLQGIGGTHTPAVGVESTHSEPSSVSFFVGNDLSSVDDVDLVAGRLATVFALLGAEGSFGVKGSADRLLPDLLEPHQ